MCLISVDIKYSLEIEPGGSTTSFERVDALRTRPWRGSPCSWHAMGKSVQHTSLSKCVQLCIHGTTTQWMWCLCSRFLVFGPLRRGLRGQWSQRMMGLAAVHRCSVKTLVPSGMHPHSAYRVLIHPAHWQTRVSPSGHQQWWNKKMCSDPSVTWIHS